MTNDNEFGDFEDDFKVADKAQAGVSIGTVPEGTYKVACCQQDISGDGVLVDYEVFTANTGKKGFKLFLEILSPDELPNADGEMVRTKGEIIEHVFWVSQKNFSYLKRDVATILGRDLKNLNELKQITWVGKTCEVGNKPETYKGFLQNKIIFFNAWTPDSGTAPAPAASTAAPAAAASTPKAEEAPIDPDF